MRCPPVDELLELGQRRALGDQPEVEAHLADCAMCSTLLATIVDQSAAAKPAPWGALAGQTLGPYRLEAQIGKGGMGAVYRGWDERLRRSVAVKVIPIHGPHSSELARRVEIEARASAAISHPNVVAVYDVGTVGDLAFVVEELVTGESLRGLLDRGPVRPPRSLELAIHLARGLAAAHGRGVLHRDLKPENLIVADDGTLKILDFGLAKLTTDLGADLDESGTIHGTVGYMAPETARGEPADAGADIFAVGAILYELCTGRRAFGGASHAERLTAVLRDTPPLDDEGLGPLAPVVARCLDKDPRRRFQSALDLAWSLELLIGVPPTFRPNPAKAPARSRRAMLAGLAVTSLGGIALGSLLQRRLARPRTPPEFRQLTYRQGRLMSARFTHDGASLLYGAEWDGGPLTSYMLRLDGGIARQLDLPPADILSVSARGELALCLGRRNVVGQSASGRLAVAPLEGGAPRPLIDDVQEADFTPDGAELAIVRRGGRGFRLELPAEHVLLDVAGWITHPRVSPDGARVACLVHPNPQDDRGDVVVVERADGRLRTLSAGWDSVAGLAWDPDGERLWFSAAAAGANSAVRTVTLGADQSLVAHTTGRFRLHDVRADGRAIVSVDAWRLRTLIGAPGASGPIERDVSLTDFSLAVDLSADGGTLLMGEFGIVESNNGTYLRPMDGGPPLRVGDGLPLALSPSGTRVAALLPTDTLDVAIYNTANAEQPALALAPLTRISWGRWLDEETLIAVGSAADRAQRLWRFAPGRGAPAPITDEGIFGRFELDSLRARLAFVDPSGRLMILDLATSSFRVLPGSYRDRFVSGWLSEKDIILLRPTAMPLSLMGVDAKTGDAAAWMEIAVPPVGFKAVDGLVLRRDGMRYAYSYGQELSQLYLMMA
jgi:hypothetical protein